MWRADGLEVHVRHELDEQGRPIGLVWVEAGRKNALDLWILLDWLIFQKTRLQRKVEVTMALSFPRCLSSGFCDVIFHDGAAVGYLWV